MNIIFLSRFNNLNDINIWSGTLYHVYRKLSERHNVKCIGGVIIEQLTAFQRKSHYCPVKVDK